MTSQKKGSPKKDYSFFELQAKNVTLQGIKGQKIDTF